jgi:YfiR/HmsC-like
LLLVGASSISVARIGWAQGGGNSLAPADIEAAYLYNFGKYVRFPAGAGQDAPTFTICLLGEDGIGGPLDNLVANESVQGRKIATRRLSSPGEAANCQIAYIGQSEQQRLDRDLAALEGKPVLTVSSLPGFLDHGGMIQFLLQNKRVRFAVNLALAERTRLELSSELLKVAVRVDAKPALEAK